MHGWLSAMVCGHEVWIAALRGGWWEGEEGLDCYIYWLLAVVYRCGGDGQEAKEVTVCCWLAPTGRHWRVA